MLHHLKYIRPEHSQSIKLDEHTLNITFLHLTGEGEVKINSNSYKITAGESLVLETQGKNDELNIINNQKNDLIIAVKYKYHREKDSGIHKMFIDDEIGKYQEFESVNPIIYQFNVSVTTNNKYSIIRTY